LIFGSFDFCSYGPREPLCITRRNAEPWWSGPQEIDGVHIFYDRGAGRVGSVTIDDPHNEASIKTAAKYLGVPVWWMRRKIRQFAD
jgi:hypothetical protein